MHIKVTFDVTPAHAEVANKMVQQLCGGATRFELTDTGNYAIDFEYDVDCAEAIPPLVNLLVWHNAGDAVRESLMKEVNAHLAEA